MSVVLQFCGLVVVLIVPYHDGHCPIIEVIFDCLLGENQILCCTPLPELYFISFHFTSVPDSVLLA